MSANLNLSDNEAERAILAAIVFADEALVQVRPLLSVNDFYSESHRVIYAACLHLQDSGISRDVLTVGDELKKRKQLEKVGNRSGLNELVGEHISLSGLVHHAEIVRKFSKRRILLKSAHALYLASQDCQNPELLASEFHAQMIANLESDQGQFVDMPHAMNQFMDELDRRRNGEVSNGYPTGLQALDLRIGGWKPGHLNLIAARPSMGKTSLACLGALVGSQAGAKVAICSLEMGASELAQRFVCLTHDSLTMKALNNANLTTHGWGELVLTIEGLQTLPIKICDTTNLTLEKIRSMASLLKMKGEVDLLIIDYLQLLALDERGISRQEAMSKASRSLKVLAKDLGISIIALSQLNRKCEDREDKRPHLADLRESGALEQDADVVLMLYRDEFYNRDSAYAGQAEILIRKQRNGPTGELLVRWIGSNSAFKDEPQQEHFGVQC